MTQAGIEPETFLSVLISSVLTFFNVLFFFCVLDKEILGISGHELKMGGWGFCVEHFKGKLSKHVNVKPNRSRLKADILWSGGGDSSLATKNFLFPY